MWSQLDTITEKLPFQAGGPLLLSPVGQAHPQLLGHEREGEWVRRAKRVWKLGAAPGPREGFCQ